MYDRVVESIEVLYIYTKFLHATWQKSFHGLGVTSHIQSHTSFKEADPHLIGQHPMIYWCYILAMPITTRQVDFWSQTSPWRHNCRYYTLIHVSCDKPRLLTFNGRLHITLHLYKSSLWWYNVEGPRSCTSLLYFPQAHIERWNLMRRVIATLMDSKRRR